MNDSLELHEFEQIEATPGTALLRITARAAVADAADGSPVLLVDDGKRVHRLSALPAPPDSNGLRSSFSAQLSILEQPASFALELPDGSVVGLPEPSRGRTSNLVRQATAAQARRDAELAELREELDQAAERAGELEQEFNAALSTIVELDAAATAAQSDTAEAEQLRAETESRLAGALHTIVELEAAVLEANEGAALMHSELEAAHAQARRASGQLRDELERANADALDVARNYEQEAAARTEAEARAERLELELTAGREEAEALRARLARTTDELDRTRLETTEASKLAQAWQADAEKARMWAAGAVAEARAARQGAVAGSEDEAEAFAPEAAGRVSAEREMAERQAANREALRARARERKQRSPSRSKSRATSPAAPTAPASRQDSAQASDPAPDQSRKRTRKPKGSGSSS